MGPTRQDTQRVTLQIKDPATGNFALWDKTEQRIWDKKTGGEVDTDIYKYKPGGMMPQMALGGSRTTGDVTLTRIYRHEYDHDRIQSLIDWCGRARCTVSQTVKDIDGNDYGMPLIWVGILKTVTPPEHDSESSDPAFIEVVISPDDVPYIQKPGT
jgi:hypothetical protein